MYNLAIIELAEKLVSIDWMKPADKYFERRKTEIINKVLKKKFESYWKLVKRLLES